MEEKDIALRLAQLRTKRNVSARDMSLSIGQNEGYINGIESGRALPSLPVLFYICDYLGITPCEFFDIDSAHPAKLHDLIQDLKRLNDQQLETISKLVKDLIN
ncbi:MAG: helix-turn-helix transcriptional regulator [Clostridia bacterium]|nr:helix-turn-helix transcriptional regulator [Clostridia bacterium]